MAEYIEKSGLKKSMSALLSVENVPCNIRQLVLDIIDGEMLADVKPVKRGKWESSQRTIETGTVYCSNCAIEYYISDLQTVGDYNGIVHYCPNCGADMRGEDNA